MADDESRQRLLDELETSRRRVEELEDVDRRREGLLEDLSLHREELRTQNDELRQAHATLEALQQRYKDLFDFAPAAYFLLDRAGTVTDVNITALQLLDADRDKLVRRPFRMFVRLHGPHQGDSRRIRLPRRLVDP